MSIMQGEHPIEQNLKRIKKEGIVVLDKVKGLPSSEGPFVSPDYVICIGHQGYNRLMYNDMYDFSEAQTVAVIFPNQSLLEISKSDDYLATLIVADSSMLNEPMLQIINQMRYRYEPNPRVKLDNHQYKMIMNVVELMLETSNLKLAERRMLHLRQLEFLLRLLGYYRQNNLNELPKDTPVSNKFLDLLKRISGNTVMWLFTQKRSALRQSISARLSRRRQATPQHIGSAHRSSWRPRCCCTHATTFQCRQSQICWDLTSRLPSAAISSVKQACHPRISEKRRISVSCCRIFLLFLSRLCFITLLKTQLKVTGKRPMLSEVRWICA